MRKLLLLAVVAISLTLVASAYAKKGGGHATYHKIKGGSVTVSDLREIQIEELLGREAVAPNELLMGKTIVGKTVMVSGAGGSIGSELCRQIIRCRPARLILLEQSEYGLYSLMGALVGYLSVLDMGLGNTIVRYTAKNRADGTAETEAKLNGLFLFIYSVILYL